MAGGKPADDPWDEYCRVTWNQGLIDEAYYSGLKRGRGEVQEDLDNFIAQEKEGMRRNPLRDGCVIYGLIDPRVNLCCYVGQSAHGLVRATVHALPSVIAASRELRSSQWLSGLIAAGFQPQVLLLEKVKTREELNHAERFWIAQGRRFGWPLTNRTSGGSSLKRYHATSEEEALGHALVGTEANCEGTCVECLKDAAERPAELTAILNAAPAEQRVLIDAHNARVLKGAKA